MCCAPQRRAQRRSQRRALFQHLNFQKSSEPTCFDTFDFQMCFAPQGRALFRHRMTIESSKSGPNLRCFETFVFKMCFAPQQCAVFQNLNFQKGSENDMFWHFLLQNVFRATTGRNFPSLIWPATSAPAALASLLFDPPYPSFFLALLLPGCAFPSVYNWGGFSKAVCCDCLGFFSEYLENISFEKKFITVAGLEYLCIYMYMYIYIYMNTFNWTML